MEKPLAGSNPMLHFQIRTPSTGVRPPTILFHGLVGDLSTDLREREEHIVDQLLGIFRHIEPVSVVMRFIKPDDYGILSYPVEKILEVSPSPQPREEISPIC